jgi:hypothetical protein
MKARAEMHQIISPWRARVKGEAEARLYVALSSSAGSAGSMVSSYFCQGWEFGATRTKSVRDPASRFAKFIAVIDAFATEHLNKKSTAETLHLSGFVPQANFIVSNRTGIAWT